MLERLNPEREVGVRKHVVSLSKTLYSSKVLVIPREWWLRPDMTDKSLTGTLNLNTNKLIKCKISRKINMIF